VTKNDGYSLLLRAIGERRASNVLHFGHAQYLRHLNIQKDSKTQTI